MHNNFIVFQNTNNINLFTRFIKKLIFRKFACLNQKKIILLKNKIIEKDFFCICK